MNSTRTLNILLIDNAAMGYMQEQFGQYFHNLGHHVTWVMMSADSPRNCTTSTFGAARVIFTPMMHPNSSFSRAANYFVLKSILPLFLPKIIKANQIDVVMVRNDVRIAALSLLLCKVRRIPFVYYLAYPKLESDLFSAKLGHKKPRLLFEIASFLGIPLRNWVTRKADIVFAMSDYWRSQLIEQLSLTPDRVHSLPAGFDALTIPDAIDPKDINRTFKLDSNPVVFYMGTITPPRDTTILIDIMKIVVRHIPTARLLLLCGDERQKGMASLKQKVFESGLGVHVIFAPTVHYRDVKAYIRAANVGLSPIEPISIFNVSSPHKLAEMLGMECPVVASNTPDQTYVLEKSGGGICVPYNSDAFANAVIYLLRHPEKARLMGVRGRAFLETERSYTVIAKKISDIFTKLVMSQVY